MTRINIAGKAFDFDDFAFEKLNTLIQSDHVTLMIERWDNKREINTYTPSEKKPLLESKQIVEWK
jgi:hypothetical protein